MPNVKQTSLQKSCLYLRDDGTGKVEALTVYELGTAAVCNAQLASIFACLTAETAVDQFHDESTNITNAFQLIRLNNVIGTMWGADNDAADRSAGLFMILLYA